MIINFVNATTYYVSNSGNDSNNGTDVSHALKTINKTNNLSIIPGDFVRFKRGDSWRTLDTPEVDNDALLTIRSGNGTANVTYADYGDSNLPQPLFIGSLNFSNSSQWVNIGTNLWTTYFNITPDLGNIILNGNRTYGVRKYNVTDVLSQGDWQYNETTNYLRFYSVGNPATVYNGIEIAAKPTTQEMMFNFDDKSNVLFANISMMNTGSSFMNGERMENITWDGLNISNGGGDWQSITRYGNCMDIQLSAKNIEVKNSIVTECYDGGLTIEGYLSGGVSHIRNINVHHNIFEYCHYPIEYFNNNASSSAYNISMHHNTFAYSGREWSRNERFFSVSDNSGMRFASSPANTSGFNFSDNIDYTDIDYAVRMGTTAGLFQGNFTLDYNLYFNVSNQPKFLFNGTDNLVGLISFRNKTKQDNNSLQADPLFVSGSYQPSSGSPACNMSSSGSYVGALPCVAPSIVLNSPVGFVYTNSVLFNWTSTGATNVSLYINGTRFYYLPVTPLEDVSSNSNDLTTSGNITFNSSGWYDFNGISNTSYFDSHVNPNATMNESFTISIDYMPIGSPNTANNFILASSSGGSNRYYFRWDSINTTKLGLGSWNPSFGNTFALNEWQNIIITSNGTYAWFYYNGALLGNSSYTPLYPATSIKIGGFTSAYKSFNGSIDNVIFLNRSVSASEASLIYNNASPYLFAKDNIVAYYSMENVSVSNQSQTFLTYLNGTDYNWKVEACDASTCVNSSEENFLIFHNPTFADTSPVNNANVSVDSFSFAVDFDITNISSILVNLNNNSYEIFNQTLLWLEFENNSLVGENNSYIYDYSNYHHFINITGNSSVGVVNGDYCRVFDGLSDYLTVENLDNAVGADNYSVFVNFMLLNKTFKVPSTNVVGGLYSQRAGGPFNGEVVYITYGEESDELYGFNRQVSNATNYALMNYGYSGLETNLLYNAIFTSSVLKYTTFIDGETDSVKVISNKPVASNKFLIGTYSSSSSINANATLNGDICKFIVFNRSVDDVEAKNDYSLKKINSSHYRLTVSISESGVANSLNYSISVNNISTGSRIANINPIRLVNVSLNFSNKLRDAGLSYGIQDPANSEFVIYPVSSLLLDYVKNITSNGGHRRIWLMNKGTTYSNLNNVPVSNVTNCSIYNYTNLSREIGFALSSDTIPQIMFMSTPPCWANWSESSANAYFPRPQFLDNFANYSADIVEWLYDECADGIFTYNNGSELVSVSCGNVNDVIWEVWNEPIGDTDPYWNPSGYSVSNYTTLYKQVQYRIKQRVPNATISSCGAFNSVSQLMEFLSYLNSSELPEYVSGHFYLGAEVQDTNTTDLGWGDGGVNASLITYLRNSNSKSYIEVMNFTNSVRNLYPSIRIINDESSFSSYYNPWVNLDNFENTNSKVVMASSLYWMLQTNLSEYNKFYQTDFSYNSTKNRQGIIMANTTAVVGVKPYYETLGIFSNYFNSGNSLYLGESSDGMIETIATDNKLMIINKYNATANVVLSTGGRSLVRLSSNGTDYDVSGGSVSLSVGALDYVLYDLTFGVDSIQSFSLFGSLTIYNKDFYIY